MSIAPLASGTAQQITQLNQLVGKYKGDIARHAGAGSLASLARQITTDERTDGVHLVLPNATPAQSPAAPAPAPVPPTKGQVNLTA